MEVPREADPSQDKGIAVYGEPGKGDPAGFEGGTVGGIAGGHVGAIALPEDAEALELLREELRVRRDPDTLDAYAWSLVHTGRWNEASAVMREALAGGIRDARLFYRAALIEQHLGRTAAADVLFQLAARTDPTFDHGARTVAGLGL